MRPLSPAALLVGRQALSGTLDHLLKGRPSEADSIEILSYTLDIIEYHVERKLISKQMLEMDENGKIKI